MKQIFRIVLLYVLATLTLGACGGPAQPTPPPGPKTPAPVATAPAQSVSQSQNWETLVAEAKKEGSVTVYNTAWNAEARTGIGQAFKDKYGINAEFSPFVRGEDLMAKIQAEQRAGLYTADVFGAGGNPLVSTMKPGGLLGHLEALLVLPEVTDPKAWRNEKLPYLDQDKYALGMIFNMNRYVMYNTQMIKEGEITSYRDVLKPEYKGKINLNDPTVSGAGSSFIAHIAWNIWNMDEAKEYLRLLVKQQEAMIIRDNRLQAEWVARGKYAIGLSASVESVVELYQAGAPVSMAMTKEPPFVAPAGFGVAVPTKMPHPNAAKVFLNWLLSKEGQTVLVRTSGRPSLRNDVSTEGIHALFLAKPGEKLFLDSEEMIAHRGEILAIAKAVVDEAAK